MYSVGHAKKKKLPVIESSRWYNIKRESQTERERKIDSNSDRIQMIDVYMKTIEFIIIVLRSFKKIRGKLDYIQWRYERYF